MRRLLFNPLAQQPYASGEYDIQYQKFILDKPLELNHVYYAVVYSTGRKSTFGPTFIDFRFKKFEQQGVITSIPLYNDTDDVYIFGLIFLENDINVNVVNPSVTPSTSDEGFKIYIYKLI